MLFNSFLFIGFFLLVIAILFTEKVFCKSVTLRNITLLLASYIFYGSFDIAFLLLLIFITFINFIVGNRLFTITDNKKRKQILSIGIVLSLIPLLFFKYTIFFLNSFKSLLAFDLSTETIEGILLPVGISFFTFQALTYIIDICRKKIDKPANFIDFALFVAFFPTILSGPIEKARNLIPQIKRYFVPHANEICQGACIFIWGLFKKIVIADRLANYVDWAYATSLYASGGTLALAAVFYSIQIYCDFSGYSDMALGIAKALGFDITKNFRQPYFSKTIKEFWKKWHIALTSWFTEYVYFSLGGNRVKSNLRWVFNISTVFILSGIWHGAAWNFIIWGALHALYYLTEHFLGLQRKSLKWTKVGSLFSGSIVFVLVTIAWIFFRVPSFNEAVYIISKIPHISDFSMGSSSFTFMCTILMLAVFLIYELSVRKGWIRFDNTNYEACLSRNICAVIPLLLLISLFGISSDNFVYLQF